MFEKRLKIRSEVIYLCISTKKWKLKYDYNIRQQYKDK